MLRHAAALAVALFAGAAGATEIRRVAILDGAVTVAAPRDYCIAPGAGQRGADSAVVLIGRCAGTPDAAPAVITVAVGQAGSASVLAGGGAALAEFFQSAAGRATLSRSGRAGDVRVLAAVGRGDVFYLRLRDRAAGDYWRAILGLKGRLVTISVAGPAESPLPPEAGRSLLEAAVKRMRAANGAAAGF
jgi:hypothetical protein